MSAGYFGSLYVGREVSPNVFAEKVATGRWMIRKAESTGHMPMRIGEVMGGNGQFLACTCKGDVKGKAGNLLGAVAILEGLSQPTPSCQKALAA